MKTTARTLAFIALTLVAAGCRTVSREAETLEKAFLTPPEQTKPWTYWYWIDDNISKEGITRDLEAMARVGIGEAFIGNVVDTRVTDNKGSVSVLTEEWWECVGHAVREGERLGVRIGMFNCPGWSQSGGPWVKPEQAMQYLSSNEIRVAGPQKIRLKPEDPAEFFRRVSLQAFPAPACDADRIGDRSPVISSKELPNAARLFDGDPSTTVEFSGYPVTIGITLPEPYTARSIQIHPAAFDASAEELRSKSAHSIYPPGARTLTRFTLEAESDNGWETVAARTIDRRNLWPHIGPLVFGPVCETFAPVTSRRFRVTFPEGQGGIFSEIELSGAAKLSHYVEKQLGKMSSETVIPFDAYVWHRSAEPGDASLTVDPSDVIDISGYVDNDGTLEWDVPPGEWIILNTGTSPTLTMNKPTTREGQGFEIDKMSRKVAHDHFDAFIGELLRRMPAEERGGLRHVIADSYEQGSQNWTDGFADDFREAYGYEFWPWLPVLTGRVVESAERSDRFLWDMRRLVADKIPETYVRGLREKCEENGLTLWLENYGHWGFPGEFLSYGGASHQVGGEFWLTPRDERSYLIECRAASSAAHIYGKPLVSAEAFTAKFTHRQTPRDLKFSGDWAFAQGINHYVLHVYIHQPDERKPGMNAWFGTDFNRHSTWFDSSKSYFEYVRRSCAVLQSGRNVADVAYFIGEDAPKMTGPSTPALPPGYDYDFINADVLKNQAKVKNGHIILPSGAEYAVLVLPPDRTMRPEILGAIARLVADGAAVLGDPPSASPSNEGWPECDEMVKRVADELWSGIDGNSVTERQYGKGRIFRGIGLGKTLARLGVKPDMTLPDVPQELMFTHRQGKGFDAYFITNQSNERTEGEFGFNVAGMRPELWDAVTGEIRDLPVWRQADGMTFVPLELEPLDSWFVVFREKAGNQSRIAAEAVNFPRYEAIADLGKEWNVRFLPSYDDPENHTFTELSDWTADDDPYIKYFSGTATYSKSFTHNGGHKKVFIDLGEVNSLAAVRINGTDCGTLWRAPYRTEITDALAEGDNLIEIDVTNCWLNRLVGDCQPGAEKLTWTPFRDWNADTPLIPSGLKGPVRLISVKNKTHL